MTPHNLLLLPAAPIPVNIPVGSIFMIKNTRIAHINT